MNRKKTILTSLCIIVLCHYSPTHAENPIPLPLPTDNISSDLNNSVQSITSFSNLFQTDNVGYINNIGSTLWRDLEEFKVDGNFTYCIYSNGFKIIDFSIPSNPVLIAQISLDGQGFDLEISGDFVYLADGVGGLVTVNISDPHNPFIVNTYLDATAAQSVFIVDTLAYISNGINGVLVLSINDPYIPNEIVSIPTTTIAQNVSVKDTILYVADTANLEVFNIADLQNPLQIGSYSWKFNYLVSERFDVLVYDTLLLTLQEGEGVTVYNASDPSNLVELSFISTFCFDMYMLDTILYLTKSGSGISVINMSDPSNPQFIVETSIYGTKFEVIGTQLYIHRNIDSEGLGLFDITDVTNPVIIGEFFINGIIRGIDKVDSLAYVITNDGGLLILNFADSTNPEVIGVYSDLLSSPVEIQVQGSYAYITVRSEGLQVLNVEDPTNPYPVGHYEVDNNDMEELEVRGDKAYICDDALGLLIIDIVDPANPVLFRSFTISGGSKGFAFSESLICISDNYSPSISSAFRIINIANPQSPFLVQSYTTTGSTDNIEIFDTLLILGNGYFSIYDITDFENVLYISTFITSGYTNTTEIQGNIFYALSDYTKIEMFMIDKAEAPYSIGSSLTPESTYDLHVSNSLIITGGHTDLSIYETNMNNAVTCYIDADLDTYGTPDSSLVVAISGFCDVDPGVVSNALDCDDTNPDIHPGAFEILDDGIDQDCDGVDASCCYDYRGNVDDSSVEQIDISDLVYLVDFMFTSGPAPNCPEEANIDGDAGEIIDISDLVYLVEFMFSGGPVPADCP